MLMRGALSDETLGLSFTIVAGLHQRSHSRARVTRDLWPCYNVTDLFKEFLDNGLVNTFQRASMEGMSQWTDVIARC
jgi:hypothetical protein